MKPAAVAVLASQRLYYDELYFQLMRDKRDDLAAITAVARERPKGRVLDLGGGFGRVARELARLGHEVTVVDLSQALLAIGEAWLAAEPVEVASLVSWYRADITQPLDELPLNWFAVAVCAHNALNEVIDDLQGVFDSLARCLESDGLAVVNAIPEAPYRNSGVVELIGSFETPDGAFWVVTSGTVPVEGRPRNHCLTFFYERHLDGRMEEGLVRSIERRVWTRHEIYAAAARAGLRPIEPKEGWPGLVLQKLR